MRLLDLSSFGMASPSVCGTDKSNSNPIFCVVFIRTTKKEKNGQMFIDWSVLLVQVVTSAIDNDILNELFTVAAGADGC